MPISTLIISIHTIGDILRHVLNYFSYAKNFGGDVILSRKVSPLAHAKVEHFSVLYKLNLCKKSLIPISIDTK